MARSSGMFPIKSAWVDAATILPANGDELVVPNLQHSEEVTVVAYFTGNAAGSVAVKDAADNILYTVAAPAGGEGKVIMVRSGYELGAIETVKLDSALLTAGAVQVSIF